MCHIVPFMPVLALPIFWLLPLPLASGIYAIIVGLSAWFYYVVIKIMHRPSRIGLQTLIDARGRVIQANGTCGLARIGRELWKIEAKESLKANEGVTVMGHRGFVLDVAHSLSDNEKVSSIS